MGKLAIVGIGNPHRGDDGAGWAVIDNLEGKTKPHVTLYKIGGDVAELIDLFSSYSTVYLVDACQKTAPAGEWQKLDGRSNLSFLDQATTSTHDFSVSQAIELAKNLNLLPKKLILYTIASDAYNNSATLSDAVAQATALVAKQLLQEQDVDSCMKKA